MPNETDGIIKRFEQRTIRSLWDEERQEWYFSIVDVVGALTDSPNPRKYWSVLKSRLKKEGSELTTNCSQLSLSKKPHCIVAKWLLVVGEDRKAEKVATCGGRVS